VVEQHERRIGQAPAAVRVPQSFRDMPRWWRGGTWWLDQLPALVADHCARWRLTVTSEPAHGSHALVVPVARGDDLLVLRLTPPGPEVADQIAALRFWDGRGTVRLIQADVNAGVMLLERLRVGASLTQVPSAEAVAVLGQMMRRLAVPAPPQVPSTAEIVAGRLATMPNEWQRLGQPFDASLLDRAMAAGTRLSKTDSHLAVNGDLHSAQVLRGDREPWLTVDPVLLRGDIAYDLARVLWTRLDDMPDTAAILDHFHTAATAADIDPDHGRDWVLYRTVDYWLWGLATGLTEDPERCRRLVHAITGPPSSHAPQRT
jgi:streptomycin 6-kinase